MRTRIAAVAAVVFALVIGMSVVSAGSASALSPGVAFAAEDQPSWQTNGTVYALGTAQGKVIAGGTFSQIRPPAGRTDAARARNALVILDAETGEPDACQFTVGINSGTPTIRAITTSPDESRVFIAGNFSTVSGVNVARIAALDVATCTVTPFRVPLPGSTVTALAYSGNTLYAGGLFMTVGGQTRQGFAAFNATSGALLPWTANALRERTDLPSSVNQGRAIAVSPDGAKVALGGDMFSINGQYSHSIALVSGANPADGTGGQVLRTYGPGFIPDTSVTKVIIDGGDGKFYIGNEGSGGGVFDGKAAFSWDTGDQVWRDTCLGATQTLVMYQGTLYSGSHAHDCSGINAYNDGIRRYFLAQNSDTMEIYGWVPLANDGIGEGIGPRALVVATGKTTGQKFMWSGGDFTNINGKAQQGLTRFGAQDTGAPPTPVASAQATSDGTIQVHFRSVVDLDDSVLTYRVYRGNATDPIWTGTGKSLWWERPQLTFVDSAVTPGTSYSYRVTASDGTNTSARSAAVTATATAPSADYAAAVRADSPQSYWTGATAGAWVQDAAGRQSRTDAVPAALLDGATVAAGGAVPGTGGSLQFDGVDDYAITDQFRQGPSTYTVETWVNTTSTSGGKIIGFGNGRPRTGTNAPNMSWSYDRHVYMQNDGRVTFGTWVGYASTLTSPQPINDGQWHHIVATQGAGGMALYIDGLRVGQNSNRDQQSYWGVWRVGGDSLNGWPNQPSSSFFAGQVDDVAIYPSVLPAGRVAAHYTASGRTLNVNTAPADAYGAEVFRTDPSLYWRFDDTNSTARDSSMFGTNPGTYNTGATTQAAGAVAGSRSVNLPGNDSGTVAVSQATSPTGTFSGEIWFRTDTTAGGKLFGFENVPTGTGGNYDKHLYMTNDGRLVWGSYPGYVATVESSQAYNDNKWHHAVGVIDDSGRRLYVDGQLVAQNNQTGAETGQGYWRVGGGNIGGWPGQPSSYYFDGELDEFAIYPTSLDATTVAQHYAIGVADTTPPSAPSALAATRQADGVHLSWTAATDDHSVASYTVYRGTTPGFAPSEDTRLGTSATTGFIDTATVAGTRYYRVVAVDAAGNVGPASNEAQVEVPDQTAPQTPAAPTATVDAGGVQVSWTASTDDVGVTGYVVHRSTTAGFTASAATQIGTSTTTSLTDPLPAPGTYYYRVVAVDAAGNASSASPTGSVTIEAPDTTAPTAPTALTATLSGDTVQVRWTASTDDRAVTGYAVYRGADAAFEPSAANRVAQPTGTSFDDTGLAPGVYHYKVTATDAAGNVSVAASTAITIEAAAEPVTLTVPIADDAMVSLTAPTTNYGASTQFSSRAGSTAIESLLSASLPATPAGTTLTRVTLNLRTSTDPTANTANATDFALIPDSFTESTVTWNTRPTTAGQPLGQLAQAPAVNTAYTVDLSAATLRASLGSTATIRMTSAGTDNVRLWSSEAANSTYRPTLVLEFTPVSGPDTVPPSSPTALQATLSGSTASLSWAASTDDRGVARYEVHRGAPGFTVSSANRIGDTTGLTAQDGPLAPGTYAYRIVAVDAAGNASTASTEATVTVTAPDTTAPSVPGAPAASVSGTSVQLSWSASTDNVGVASYDVFRGTSSGFVADAASRIATVTTTSHTDASVAPGTYWYRVVARDAAGNGSAASGATQATVTAPVQTVTATAAVEADAGGYASTPTQNYGTTNQLVSRGDTSAQQSFLRVTLPALPAGATLVSANLALRTSTDPAAGSTGSHDIAVVTGAWDEATLNWNNRPTTVAASLGTLTGATATNTAYGAALAVDQLRPLLGQTITLRVSTTSSDNLRFGSRESTSAAARPSVTLTYTLP